MTLETSRNDALVITRSSPGRSDCCRRRPLPSSLAWACRRSAQCRVGDRVRRLGHGAWSFASRSLQPTYGVALAIFLLHACEEFLTGFQRRLPALVGDHWTDRQFLVFNAAWFATFVVAGWALRQRHPLAVLIVLFFALGGGVGNGIAHLLIVVSQRGYFPGAWTAPLCLLVGTALLRQLFTIRTTA